MDVDDQQVRPEDGSGVPEPAPGQPDKTSEPPEASEQGKAPSDPGPAPSRARGRTALIVVVAVIALAALGAAAWIYADTVGSQRVAVERLDRATTLVEQADGVVLDLDEIVRAEIDETTQERAEDVAGRVPDAIADLEEAIELIDAAQEDLPERDVAYALALRDSGSARLEMLAVADPILEANRKAAAAIGPANAGWEAIIDADELSNEAAEEYSKLTEAGVERSTELADEAIGRIEDARTYFSEAATAFPEVDFGPYDEYCEKKLEALEISKEADAAWLADDIAEANRLGARYNEADQELTELAEEFPSAPAILIANAFESLAADPMEAYFEARARATAADARLREVTDQPESEPEEDESGEDGGVQDDEGEPNGQGGTDEE